MTPFCGDWNVLNGVILRKLKASEMTLWGGGGGLIDRVADMNMLKAHVPPSSINSYVGTTGLQMLMK